MKEYGLLINDSEPHFRRGAKLMRDYLVSQAHFSPENIATLSARHHSFDAIAEGVDTFLNRIADDADPFLFLFYAGHGQDGSMYIAHRELKYEKVAERIDSRIPFVFLNDCCSAGSAIPAFRSHKLLPFRGLVIGSSKEGEEANDGERKNEFLSSVLSTWAQRRVFKKRRFTTVSRAYSSRQDSPDADQVIKMVQHPIRYGRTLDWYLFPK